MLTAMHQMYWLQKLITQYHMWCSTRCSINKIVSAYNLSKPYIFADDGALLFNDICRKTYLNIKIEIMTIIKWLSVNKLSLNIEKIIFYYLIMLSSL